MKTKLRTFGAVAVLASVSPLAFMTPAALAQEEAASANREVIVVTARRTEESLQDVPGAVSAFSEAALERIDVTDSTGLQGAVPNLNIVQGRGSSNATNIYIRGVGQPDALQTFDPAVGFYVDDVYFSRIRGTQLDLFDIERIEVLRGPQGTLYGKNTIGGALRVITRRPDQETRGQFQVGLGNYSLWEARASVSGGLAENLAGSVALFGTGRDGFVTNPNTGEEYNDRNASAARVALAWDAAPGFTVDWNADWSRENNALTMGQPINTLTTLFGVPILPVPSPVPAYDFTGVATPGLPNSTEMTHWGTALTINWELSDNLNLRSITAYRELEYDDYIDIDATALETGDVLVAVDQDQISQEFQLNYETDRLTVVSGLFYMLENITSHQEAYADDLLTGPGGFTFLRTIDDDLETRSWALYVNATYNFTDRLSMTAGVRYTDEQKDYFRTTSTFSSFPGLTVDPSLAFTIEDSWTNTSPMVSLDYRASDNVLLYGRVSQGFKSGGFNGRANNPGEQAPYDPETVTSYEFGVKTDWLDNTLRANFTVFYNDYEDFQARVSGLVTDPVTNLPVPQLTVLNAGSLEISGFEAELSWSPVPELLLDAQIGYLNAEYGEFDDARFTNFGGSRAFQTPAFSPEWTTRLGAAYDFDLAENGTLRLAGSARYRSRMALAVDNTPVNSNVEIEGLFQDAYWLFDANAVWTNRNGNYSVGLYGRNLADEVYRTDGQDFSSVGNIRTVYYGAPRTWRLVFTARY
jgi:iron complex outermembrane recepter protein